MGIRSTVLFAVCLMTGAAMLAASARAQGVADYPSKPIRWIVASQPGSSPDVVARIVAQRLSVRLKQPVIVDNRAGAFGNIGMEAAVRAAPDGYTLFLAIPSVTISPVLYKLGFDPMTELAAVTQLARVSFVLLVHPEFAARTVPELLAAAKARPGSITCGWAGPLPQFACEFLRIQGGVNIRSVPYKGQPQAMTDLIGGQIDLLLDVVNVALPQVNSRRVRALATTNPKRGSGPFAELEAVNESLPGFEFAGWHGVLVPGRTPPAIVDVLNREIRAVLDEEDVRKRLIDSGLEVVHGLPAAFAEIMRRDHALYSKIIQQAGIKAD